MIAVYLLRAMRLHAHRVFVSTMLTLLLWPQGWAAALEQRQETLRIDPTYGFNTKYPAVAVDGTRIISGMGGRFGELGGYIFERTPSGFDVTDLSMLANPPVAFGQAVDIDGDVAVVGAPNETFGAPRNKFGAIYIFLRDSAGTWRFHQKIEHPDPDRYYGLNGAFGGALAVKGHLIVARAFSYFDGFRTKFNVCYIFRRNPGSGLWTLERRLTQEEFVACNGDVAVGTALLTPPTDVVIHGSCIFRRTVSPQGPTWSLHQVLSGVSKVRLGGRTIAAQRAGGVAIFELHNNQWKEAATLTLPLAPPVSLVLGHFAVSDGAAVLIAIQDRVNTVTSSTAYLYSRTGAGWDQQPIIRFVPSNPGPLSPWGAIDLDGARLAIASNSTHVQGGDQIYVYEGIYSSSISTAYLGEGMEPEIDTFNWANTTFQGTRRLDWSTADGPRGLALSRDGGILYASTSLPTLFGFDARTLHPVKAIGIGGANGRIAVDQSGHWAFVAHGTGISVITDLTAGEPTVREIPLPGGWAIDILPDSGGIACPPTCSTPVAVVRLGPTEIAFTAFSDWVRSLRVTVPNSVALAVKPNFDNYLNRKVFLAGADGSTIITVTLRAFDQLPLVVTTPMPLVGGKSVCPEPHSMSFSPGGNFLYLGCRPGAGGGPSKFAVLNSTSLKLVAMGSLAGSEAEIPEVKATPDGKHVWFRGLPEIVNVVSTQDYSVRQLSSPTHPSNVVFGGPRAHVVDNILRPVTVTSNLEGPSACAPGQIYRITMQWRNNSIRTLTDVHAEVSVLTGGNTLMEQTWNLGPTGAVPPGGVFTGTFRIRLVSCDELDFRVNVVASLP